VTEPSPISDVATASGRDGRGNLESTDPRPTITMSLSALLIALVVLFIIATVPVWPYSRTWGLRPSGALGLVLVVLVGLLVMG
jgi:hypothetical protein